MKNVTKLQYRTISKRTVGKLPVGEKDAVYWDRELPGFGVRVYPNGTKVYVVQTRAGGKSKRIAVGRHGVISPDQARRKAAQMIARIKAGEDPDPDAMKRPAGPTVAELTERLSGRACRGPVQAADGRGVPLAGQEIRAARPRRPGDRRGRTQTHLRSAPQAPEHALPG